MLLFEASGTPCAVDLDELDEVLMAVPLDGVPGAPTFLLGTMTLRGRLLPVVSLAGRVGTGGRAVPGRGARILLTKVAGRRLGFLVDRVIGVREFEEDARRDAVLDEGGRPALFVATWMDGGRTVQQISLRQALSGEELALVRGPAGASETIKTIQDVPTP